ncbi:hypothetical protein [Sigmofec virus UA08Rod_6051]|uniref:Uncharacterized protein n=1 Tax=Sigmofec virus UA08Rod_6051 TaxID=2929449 RepID=A0A976N152_9VIRU|nr:hypothetical protein [Sigmofec virus UA08Rod_6051]
MEFSMNISLVFDLNDKADVLAVIDLIVCGWIVESIDSDLSGICLSYPVRK